MLGLVQFISALPRYWLLACLVWYGIVWFIYALPCLAWLAWIQLLLKFARSAALNTITCSYECTVIINTHRIETVTVTVVVEFNNGALVLLLPVLAAPAPQIPC